MWQRLTKLNNSSAEETKRTLTAWTVLAGLLLFAALAAPFWTGRLYTADDLGAYHLPVRAYYAQQIARGEPFDWMPSLFCGFYLTGEGQFGGYHPVHWLLYRVFPWQTAIIWELLLPYPFMMLGMWLFLRRRLASNAAAAFGGLLFAYCSFNLLHFVHPNAIAIIAHIPWLLWAIDIVLRDSQPSRIVLAAILIALLTGSEILLGYPQYVWFSLLIEGGYAGLLLYAYRYDPRCGYSEHKRCNKCIGCTTATWPHLLLAKIIGVLIGGVQLVPTIDAWLHSSRQAADAQFAYWGSLHPLNLLQLVAPYMFSGHVIGDNSHEFGVYLGAAPLMLGAWLLARRCELRSLRPLAQGAGWLALFAVLMALGQNGPLYRLLMFVPGFNVFRFPCRYSLLLQFAAAVWAAIGFVLLLRENQQAHDCRRQVPPLGLRRYCTNVWREFEPMWALVAVAMAIAVTGLKLRHEPYIASVSAILVGPTLCLSAALLIMAASRGYRSALVGLILLAAVDQGGYWLNSAACRQTAHVEQWLATTSCPPQEPRGRVLASLLSWNEPGLRTGNQMVLAGWARADGYTGLQPQQELNYGSLPALRVAGVRWVKNGETTHDIAGLKSHDGQWLEVPQPLPRVRLLTKAAYSNDPARDLLTTDTDAVALTDVPFSLPDSKPGTARMVQERPGRLEIETDSPDRQLLVVNESYHSGWQAVIDGQPTRVYRINGDFLGCVVDAGKRHVVLTFHPESLAEGRRISLLGIGLLLVLCFSGCRGLPRRLFAKGGIS